MIYKPKKWKITNNRFVVFIDILGFKDLVMRETHEKVLELLNQTRTLNGYIFKNYRNFYQDIHIVTFSDSIILFTNGELPQEFNDLITVSGNLLARMLSIGIPVKGAIAHGKISVDKENQIFFGQPIIDSYQLCEDLVYLGIVAHNSIDKYIHGMEDVVKRLLNIYIIEFETPFKYGTITHTNLNWFMFSTLLFRTNNKINKHSTSNFSDWLLNSLATLKNNVSGHPRRYIENTFRIFNEMKVKDFD